MIVLVWVFVILSIATLLVDVTSGCVRKEPREGNPLNGALKCYQCTSGDSLNDRCRFSNWKYVNRTERRYMEMQCPRKSSAFCLLKISLKDEDRVERGCFKDHYQGTNRKAYEGCFQMGEHYRACLCRTDLCNPATCTFTHLSTRTFLLISAVRLVLL